MYNLMVTAADNAWEERSYVWDKSRVFESPYTSEEIRIRLVGLAPAAIAELCSFPTLFTYEHGTDGVSRFGKIKQIQQRGSEVRVVIELDEGIPPLPREAIMAHEWDLEIQTYEFNRTHWAVKSANLDQIIHHAEARFIFDSISNTLRFIKTIEGGNFGK